MAFGHEKHDFLGRLVKKPVLRRNEKGESYCYFELAVNYPQKPDADRKRDAKFFKLLAQKWGANMIAAADKGDWISVTSAYSRQTTNTTEKEGKIYVYQDITYVCDRVDVIKTGKVTGQEEEATKTDRREMQEGERAAMQDEFIYSGAEEPEKRLTLTKEEVKLTSGLPF